MLLSGVLQLAVAVATITLVLVTGIESILGLGPAIFLTAGALAALPAGRLMDRYGRVPVIAGGFVVGFVGCVLTALGCVADSAPLVDPRLPRRRRDERRRAARAHGRRGHVSGEEEGARDLVRPLRRALRRRARAARLPAAVRGKDLELDTLVIPWFAAAAMCVVGLVDRAPDPARSAHDRARAAARGARAGARAARSRRRRSARSCAGRACRRR